MQIATIGTVAITPGWVIALFVLFLAVLGLIGIVPASEQVLFGLIGALAIARLI